MEKLVCDSFISLHDYVESENYKGYDPYDTLNSYLPFRLLGKWPATIATQIQKRNPINIRPLLGINKEINPKAYGLFLHSYSLLYQKTQNLEYLNKADYFFNWLAENSSEGFEGFCWGYNFPWVNPDHYYDPYTPSSVVTSFVCRGVYEYYQITQEETVEKILKSASKFVLDDILETEFEEGICFSYTPQQRDLCFNASLLAAEILARVYSITNDEKLKGKAVSAVNWVISKQKGDGRWNYSIDPDTGREREQIDFHQGYVLESIHEIKNLLKIDNDKWDRSLRNGLDFYRKNQFTDKGISFWRWPRKYPIDIHNQSQGVITFHKLHQYYPGAKRFAEKVADWTIKNMQAEDGHIYYQDWSIFKNKISYMRWSNAWMFLALVYLRE